MTQAALPDTARLAADFAAALDRLGPFGTPPRLAAAVSGGADSTALAVLARDWAQARGGTLLALIVDHGLRSGSSVEAARTQARLADHGIESRRLTLTGLHPGAGLQESARAARHAVLAQAAREAGIVHILLGHHADDQAETVAMRRARGERGAEGIAAWTARADVALLRPLLGLPKARLTAFLAARGIAWEEDPSNVDPRFERARLRCAPPQTRPDEMAPARRSAEDAAAAEALARHATLRPEGFALLATDRLPQAALAALLRALGGRLYPPRRDSVRRLAEALGPATIGGVRIARAGRLGPGFLLAREPAALAPPIQATEGAFWDGRFRLHAVTEPGLTLGALGSDAARLRVASALPALVLRGLPALRRGDSLLAVPHLGIGAATILFEPPVPVAALRFQEGLQNRAVAPFK